MCQYVSVYVCVFVFMLVARIVSLVPKAKFPELREGLLKQAGIKIVCVHV